GVAPACVGGHSLGGVTAPYAAGALRVGDFLRVARPRGGLMAAAAAAIPGAMTAVARPVTEVAAWLADWQLDVVIANHNSPTQVVLSGSTEAIAQAEARLAEVGATAKRLPVATAFHSPLVSGSSEPFFRFLQDVTVSPPTIPVFSNAAAAPYDEDPAAIRRTLADQLGSPVRFVEMIEAMYASGVRTFVEVGPGGILTDLVERCLKDRDFQAVNLDRKGQHGVTSLWQGLGKLAAAGIAMDLAPLWLGYALPKDGGDAKPTFSLAINGSNYGKPYPAKDGSNRTPPPNPPAAVQVTVAPAMAADVTAVTAQATRAVAAPTQVPAAAVPHTPRPTAAGPVAAETQRLAAEAHATFQQALADSHQAFMQTFQVSVVQSHQAFIQAMEASFLNVCQALGGQAPAVIGSAPAVSMPTVPEVVAVPQPTPLPGAPPTPLPLAPPTQPVVPMAPLAQSPVTASTVDLKSLLMAVVADKTGYPVTMLSADMALEADLGIDSIKRVEILSAMQEQVPDLPKVDLAIMGTLRSLGEIAAYLGDSLPAPTITSNGQPTTPSNDQPASDLGSVDLAALLLAIVADKTGYPVSMLTTDMALEADLGIDSIKRVEILSAMQEQVPDLPRVDLAVMGTLRSLGEIAGHLRSAGAAPTPNVPVASGQPAPITAVSRQIVKAVAAPATGHDMLLGLTGTVAVTNDGTGVAEALVYRLRKHGLTATLVDTVPDDAAAIVFLGGLRGLPDIDAALAINREAFQAAKAVGAKFERSGGVFVLVQDTGGDFGLSGCAEPRAWLGGLAGLAKTAAQEWPTARVKAVDLARGEHAPMALADALFEELQAGGTEVEVGLQADGSRVTLTTVPATVTSGANPVTAQSVIVASGGARGVTATALIALAQEAQPRLILLGRTALDDERDEPAACQGVLGDAALKGALLAAATAAGKAMTPAELSRDVNRIQASRDIRATLAALAAAGSVAAYVAVDVQDAAALAAALAPIRAEWGPITGIVHGAGVLADKPITAKSTEQFDRVFNTKVLGLRALLAATADDPLDVICLFSSVAGRSGNVGQSDYAMANEILNKVAGALAVRPGGQCRVKALNWGPWAGGMVTPALQAHFQSRGVALIPPDIGADMFVAELRDTSPGAVEVVIGSPLVEPETRQMAITVNQSTYPFLVDHSIQSVPVVPAMLAMEWFARAATTFRPNLTLLAVRDLKVLKGIPVESFDGAGLTLSVSLQDARDGETTALQLILLGAQGQRHYMATVEMGRPSGAPLTAPFQRDELGLGAIPWPASETYDSILFHGPDFQVIRSLDGVSDTGISGVLAGAADLDWPDGPWQLDVALLDGALQLAGLWGYNMQGRASLPTRVGRCRMRSPGLLQGPIQCTVRTRGVGEHRTVSHVVFTANGQVIGDMEDVECHLLPATTAATTMEVV
ncbi:MAG: SDR family oxidoreductase, partial [Candidatus Sericytochromatia bacterium]|nr:SDR family oxidoreductase [Candidatus Sericytochromatia bacterium]